MCTVITRLNENSHKLNVFYFYVYNNISFKTVTRFSKKNEKIKCIFLYYIIIYIKNKLIVMHTNRKINVDLFIFMYNNYIENSLIFIYVEMRNM